MRFLSADEKVRVQRSTHVLKLCPRGYVASHLHALHRPCGVKTIRNDLFGRSTVVDVLKRNFGSGPVRHLRTDFVAFDSYGSTDSGVLRSSRRVGSRTSGRLRHSGRHRRYDDSHVVCTHRGLGTPSRAIDLFVQAHLLSPRIFLPTPNVRGLGLGKAFMEV
jgi:hypothetical protein